MESAGISKFMKLPPGFDRYFVKMSNDIDWKKIIKIVRIDEITRLEIFQTIVRICRNFVKTIQFAKKINKIVQNIIIQLLKRIKKIEN